MNVLNRLLFLVVASGFIPFFSAVAFADTPIKAKVVHVEGEAHLFSIKDSKQYPIKKGLKVLEGDRIKTGSKGVVEVEFDTGDLIHVGNNSDLVVKTLHRNKKGSTFSVFNLLVGKVKSAVTKLVDKDSKFEYHTKAAIAGVAGTPPFIVGYNGGNAEVDLLGKKGDHGAVYVQGTDPSKTRITIPPGFRATAGFGKPPTNPFKISSQRRQNLNRQVPFRVKPKSVSSNQEQVPQEQKQPEKKEAKKEEKQGVKPAQAGQAFGGSPRPHSVEESMVINTLNKRVSKPRVSSPDEAQGLGGIDNQARSAQGIIGQNAESGGTSAPPPAGATIDIYINTK